MTESFSETVARLVASRAPKQAVRVGVVWRVDLSPTSVSQVVRDLALEVREDTLDRVVNLSRAAHLVGDLHDVETGKCVGRVDVGSLEAIEGVSARFSTEGESA